MARVIDEYSFCAPYETHKECPKCNNSFYSIEWCKETKPGYHITGVWHESTSSCHNVVEPGIDHFHLKCQRCGYA